MLKTETNTQRMKGWVLDAAHRAGVGGHITANFEHGQWWITDIDTGAQWSVCDADGSEEAGVFYGFSCEQVTLGDED